MEQLWQIHPAFGDSFIQEIFKFETNTLTKALHGSSAEDLASAGTIEPFFPEPDTAPAPTPNTRRSVAASSGRVAKRKPRASKRATTTFIAANPADFRWMVQQVTGGRFGGLDGDFRVAPALKREPCMAVDRLRTSDLSDFSPEGPSAAVAADGRAPRNGLQFVDSFCGFPTLESWKVE